MKLSHRVIAELSGGMVAIMAAFALYFAGTQDRLWMGICIGGGCILLGAAALTLSQLQEK
jgi:hypothetical protein